MASARASVQPVSYFVAMMMRESPKMQLAGLPPTEAQAPLPVCPQVPGHEGQQTLDH
jgi:hypothetical protein